MLWEDLRPYIPSELIPWMAIRDFNAILSLNDKSEGRYRGKRCLSFGEFLKSNELYDLGFSGPLFT